jgi:hypothetical protein
VSEIDKTAILKRSMEIWRERELQFDPRCRRMKPDEIEKATGTWAACIVQALTEAGH